MDDTLSRFTLKLVNVMNNEKSNNWFYDERKYDDFLKSGSNCKIKKTEEI